MKKILTILITSLLWCSSSSANTQDNVLKWISKYDSITDDKKLILCIPAWENSKDSTINMVHKYAIKNKKDNKESSSDTYNLFIKTFGHLHRMQTVAYLSMTKDSESYLKGKNNIKNLDLYESLGDVFKLYTKESVDLFNLSNLLLNDSSEWIVKYKLFTKCTNNYLLLTYNSEKIKEIKEDISTVEYKETLLEVQSENFANKLINKIDNEKKIENLEHIPTIFKLISVYDYEVMLEKAKTDKETSDKLQAYLIGLSDGMSWTDDFHKKINKKRIYCLGNKTPDVFIMMAVVNNHIKNKNYTDDQKKLFPIGLIVADAFKTEFPCN